MSAEPWAEEREPGAPRPLANALAPRGFTVLEAPAFDAAELAAPWQLAARLAGEPVRMVERQVVRAVPGGRTFASTSGDTPLHADSQLYLGRPADLQVLCCVRPAARGGESTLLDTWRLLAPEGGRASVDLRELTRVVRRFPFVSGPIEGPTLARFDDRVAFVHTPRNLPGDPLAERVKGLLAGGSIERHRLGAGEALVVHNHRVLHGRASFDDTSRELVRLLIWLVSPLPAPAWLERAVEGAPPARTAAIDAAAERDLALVLRMLAGASPGALARETGLPEPRLYELRDRALAAALAALEQGAR
jgi:gamma-butyrobetaine dioxygenase